MSRNIITIKSIDIIDFLRTNYGFTQNNEINTSVPSSNIKKSSQIRVKREKPILFLDQHKFQSRLWPTMATYTTQGPLPLTINKPCWQCRIKINGQPKGCPLRYVSPTKDTFEIELFRNFLEKNNLPTTDETFDYFESEGMFCDLGCIKSYILEQLTLTKHPKYRKALTLLTLLQQKLYGTSEPIPLANSWKMVQEWSGQLTASEYRAARGKRVFHETINVKRPIMYSSSTYFQENCAKN